MHLILYYIFCFNYLRYFFIPTPFLMSLIWFPLLKNSGNSGRKRREKERGTLLLFVFSLSDYFQVLCQIRATRTSGGATPQTQQQTVFGSPAARITDVWLDTASVSWGFRLLELHSCSETTLPHDDSRRAHYRRKNYRATSIQRVTVYTSLATCLLF